MLVEILIGMLIGIISIDRIHRIVAILPWLFNYLYYYIMKPIKYPDLILTTNDEYQDMQSEKYQNIPIMIDDSLTKLLDAIYSTYVNPISEQLDLSQDAHKIFRQTVRTFFSDLYNRASKVDANDLIVNNIIPKTIQHLVLCKRGLQKLNGADKNILQKIYPIDEIHSGAMYHHYDEEKYLKNLTEAILHLSLTEQHQSSRIFLVLARSVITFYVLKPLIEFLSTPASIRYILHFVILRGASLKQNIIPQTRIPILRNFVRSDLSAYRKVSIPPRNFMLTWKQLQSNPSLLYVCLRVLKHNNRYEYPNFCITVEEWMSKLSRLDSLTEKARENHVTYLISEASKIVKNFIIPDPCHRINFNRSIIDKVNVTDFESCSEDSLHSIQHVIELSYNAAYEILVTDCLDLFYRSPQFYMLCFGEKPKIDEKIFSYHLSQSRKEFGIHAMSGSFTNEDPLQDVNNTFMSPESPTSSDIEPMGDCASFESTSSEHASNIDLSSFVVRIKDLKTSLKKNGKSFVFVIYVTSTQSKDQIPKTWEIYRQYKEFYGLENRMKRFHGGRITHFLPPKRSILFYKNFEFLKKCKKPFEDYLDTLLRNQYLRYSSMLYAFFTNDTTVGTSSIFAKTISIDTGRAFQTMIGTLSSEKGRYIEVFINSFFMSTEQPKTKFSLKPSLTKLKRKFDFLKDQYVPNSSSNTHWQNTPSTPADLVHDIIKALIIVAKPNKIITSALHFIYAAFGGLAELFFNRWVRDELRNLFSPPSVSKIIDFITSIVTEPTSKEESEAITNESLIETLTHVLHNVALPSHVCSHLSENMDGIVTEMMQVINHTDLNKQLLFTVLDHIVGCIYPELTELQSMKPTISSLELMDNNGL